MRKLFVLLIAAMALGISAPAKEIKRPDTYAYTRGVEAYDNEDYDEALDWFSRELSEHPDNGYAEVYIAIIRGHNNEYGKALTSLDKAMRHLPKKDKEWRAIAQASRAAIHLEMEDTVSALKDFAEAIKTAPENTGILKQRAQLYFETGDYALSDADYDRMIQKDPGDVVGYMGKGRNANKQERWDDALALFNRVEKLAPDYASGYSFRADTYIGQQKWNEATSDIIKALDLAGDDKAFFLMITFPQEGVGLMKQKLKIQAAKEPTNAYWPYCLGVLLKENAEYREAIPYFLDADKKDPNPLFPEKTAQCFLELKEYEEGLDYADRSLAMNPEDYMVVSLRADLLARLGRFDESVAERDRVVAEYPGSFMAYLERAETLMEARRYKEAIEDYNTIMMLKPELEENPVLLMKRGDAYRLTGDDANARKDYENLLKAEADSTLTPESVSPFAYSALGDAPKAIETMRLILESDTTDRAGSLYNMACIYARLGMNDDAVEALGNAVEAGYDHLSHMEADYDLDGVRDTQGYRQIKASLEAGRRNREAAEEDNEDSATYETVEVPFTKEGGVTKVQCTINGLPLHFVFDTGASDVTISMVEANFMLKNDYIKPSDILGSARYITADGSVTEGTVINLRNVDFGGFELDNVRASVVRNQKAPLLLGQSVLGRLGRIEIDNREMKLKITHKTNR